MSNSTTPRVPWQLRISPTARLSMYERSRLNLITPELYWVNSFVTHMNDYPCVYFIHEPRLAAFKIGHSTDVVGRIRQLDKALRSHPCFHDEAWYDDVEDHYWDACELLPELNIFGLAFSLHALEFETLLHSMYRPYRLTREMLTSAAAPTEWYDEVSILDSGYKTPDHYIQELKNITRGAL